MITLIMVLLTLIWFGILGAASLGYGVDSSASSNDPRRPAEHAGLD
jgi:hypothetical protein